MNHVAVFWKRVLPRTGIALFVGAACASDIPHMKLEGAAALIGEPVHLLLADTTPRGSAILRAQDLKLRDDSLFVVDNAGDRVLVLDTALNVGRQFGRTGSGPGELRYPMRLVVGPDWIAVSEMTNGRISIFRRGGQAILRLVPAVTIDFVVARDGTIFRGSDDTTHYLEAIDTTGARRPFGRIPFPDEPSTARAGTVLSMHTTMTRDGAIHVLDNGRGILIRYNRRGEPELIRRVPREIERAFRAQLERAQRDFGGRVISAGLAKSLVTTASGELFLGFYHPEYLGLLIDPSTYSARPVLLPADSAERKRLQSGGAMVFAHGRLYAEMTGGLGVYALLSPDHE